MSRKRDSGEFRVGEGFISGTLGFALGALSVGAVLCFRYPALLTTPELRALYPVGTLRMVLAAAIFLSFLSGVISVVLNRRSTLGWGACALATTAWLLGGSTVAVPARVSSSYYLGLDWFVLDLLLVALVFVPLERVNPLRPQQRVFRPGLRTDIWYFFSSHVLVQVMSFCVLSPALFLSNHVSVPAVREVLRSQPVILQFFEAMFIADLVQYAVHRAFHRVPWLWRFHAIHHSAQSMDWIAGARLHLLDTIATRGAVLAALMVLGFSQAALQGYLVFVAFWATFIHANVAWELRWLSPWLATPVFHHWHHAVGTECMDKNFAVHFTVLDRWFGTYYLPRGRWPRRYGI